MLFKRSSDYSSIEPVSVPPRYLWALAVALIGYNIFSYGIGSGIGQGIFAALLTVSVYLTFEREKRGWAVHTLTLLSLIIAFAQGFRANEFVRDMNDTALGLILVAMLLLRAVNEVKWEGEWLLESLLRFGLRSIRQVPLIINTLATIKNPRHPKLITALKTVLITLAMLIFFTYLLSSADPVFDTLVREVREQIAGRTIMTVLLATFFSILISFKLSDDRNYVRPVKWLGYAETLVPLIALALLFAAFLVIQYRYLFGGQANFASLDITYADYVRKGFMELLTAIFFGSMVCYIAALMHRRLAGVQSRAVQVAGAIVLMELCFFLLSAWKRDVMYMEMYGLTRVRIIGEVFLVWLAGVLLLLIVFMLIKAMRERCLLAGGLALCTGVLVFLNASNMDSRIANSKPPRNQPKDYVYINMLSADAYSGWEESILQAKTDFESIRSKSSLNNEDKQILANAKLSMLLLQDRKSRIKSSAENLKWQQYNKSEKFAAGNIGDSNLWLEPDCLIQEIEDYQYETSLELHDLIWKRIYDYRYPFIDVPYIYPLPLESIIEDRQNGQKPPQSLECSRI